MLIADTNIGNKTENVNGHVTDFGRGPFRSSYRTMSHLAEILERIERRLIATNLSASAASKLAGKSEAIRNIQRAVQNEGDRQGVSTSTLNALAPVLQTTSIWLFAGAGPESINESEEVTREHITTSTSVDTVEAVYGGRLQAGSWREVDDADDPDREPEVVARDDRFPRERYVVFEVVGDSMNAADPPMPDGCRILAVATDNPSRPIALRTGDLVVIQRKRAQGGLIERSVKELEIGDEETRYLPRSTNPRHKPIVFRVDSDDEDESVEVLGLVLDVMHKVKRR